GRWKREGFRRVVGVGGSNETAFFLLRTSKCYGSLLFRLGSQPALIFRAKKGASVEGCLVKHLCFSRNGGFHHCPGARSPSLCRFWVGIVAARSLAVLVIPVTTSRRENSSSPITVGHLWIIPCVHIVTDCFFCPPTFFCCLATPRSVFHRGGC
ncbi:unnamed protein product, partial [Discosporangium mesarthrocarpum]